MLELLYKLGFTKYIDYKIVGHYYERSEGNISKLKHTKKYYIKKKHK